MVALHFDVRECFVARARMKLNCSSDHERMGSILVSVASRSTPPARGAGSPRLLALLLARLDNDHLVTAPVFVVWMYGYAEESE